MRAFTNARRVVRLRNALQNLTFIDLNEVLVEWVREAENAVIREAEQLEARLAYHHQLTLAGVYHVRAS